MNPLEPRWWQRQNQYAWWFWVDPWGYMHIAHNQAYYINPKPEHISILKENGWQFNYGNPHFYTHNKAAAESFEVGKIYWYEPTYYI